MVRGVEEKRNNRGRQMRSGARVKVVVTPPTRARGSVSVTQYRARYSGAIYANRTGAVKKQTGCRYQRVIYAQRAVE